MLCSAPVPSLASGEAAVAEVVVRGMAAAVVIDGMGRLLI
jgi:hypothetical protein